MFISIVCVFMIIINLNHFNYIQQNLEVFFKTIYYNIPDHNYLDPINIYSFIHFIEYGLISFLKVIQIYHVLIISLLWEIVELFLEFEWSRESWLNKIFDVLFNFSGFLFFRKIFK